MLNTPKQKKNNNYSQIKINKIHESFYTDLMAIQHNNQT